MQGALKVLIGLFCRIVFFVIIVNLKIMTFQLEAILSGVPDEVFGRHSTGEGATYW